MEILIFALIALAVVALIGLTMALKIVKQYEKGVLFRFGRLIGTRAPGAPAARQHEARDGPPGRGRTGEEGQDHQRGGRIDGRSRTR
ncbi:hypothetical protein ACFVX6_33565 [Streptomyces sp. NPDC058289]|uniref:hypothetical protein n=1 Tax=Streptomyces sp. NPDC058289 TaxID=3346425 RepID=UPI0036E2162A